MAANDVSQSETERLIALVQKGRQDIGEIEIELLLEDSEPRMVKLAENIAGLWKGVAEILARAA